MVVAPLLNSVDVIFFAFYFGSTIKNGEKI